MGPNGNGSMRDNPQSINQFVVRENHNHPQAQSVDGRPHDLETPMMSSPALTTTLSHNLPAQLQQIRLRALCPQVDDFWRAPPKLAGHQVLEQLAQAEIAERSRQSGTAPASVRNQEIQTHGLLRVVMAQQN
jgi:hypothetical protein